MPQVLINNKSCDLNIQNIRTLKELIPKIKDDFLSHDEVLYEIILDSRRISPWESGKIFNANIFDFKNLNFKINKVSNLQETLNELPDFIEELINNAKYCSKLDSKINNDLYEVIEKIDLFIQLIREIHKSLNINSNDRLDVGLTIKELQVHLLFVVKAITFAYKKKDRMVLQDLLEYELIDNLTQWKIQALPKIKKLNSF